MDHDDARSPLPPLHESGTFTMPNPHDVGSAGSLRTLGFEALATTTSSGVRRLARPPRHDRRTRRARRPRRGARRRRPGCPLNVDAEQCFPDAPGGVAGHRRAARRPRGRSGCSIEDWDPAAGRIEPLGEATGRVAEAAGAARARGHRAHRAVPRTTSAASTTSTTRSLGSARTARRVPTCVYAPVLVGRRRDRARGERDRPRRSTCCSCPGGPTRDAARRARGATDLGRRHARVRRLRRAGARRHAPARRGRARRRRPTSSAVTSWRARSPHRSE